METEDEICDRVIQRRKDEQKQRDRAEAESKIWRKQKDDEAWTRTVAKLLKQYEHGVDKKQCAYQVWKLTCGVGGRGLGTWLRRHERPDWFTKLSPFVPNLVTIEEWEGLPSWESLSGKTRSRTPFIYVHIVFITTPPQPYLNKMLGCSIV